ncbi:CUB domain-containing protein [Oceanihabitans sediminis]|uniref:CUB domain-containing protein n=1 Tax=Oceanihabitans sediminis TaxID=1812012 RepID=UPI00299E91E3|nr:CUB domain-containing protein [Oceanihabitans sediminis]MDX1278962.1 CUB domain-containing protein [Oceanihabitans sediminis]
MKKITLLLIFASLFFQNNFAQGDSVANAEQFCSGGSELVFPNVTEEPNLTDVGCLGSIPNAAYYYLTIAQPGDLIFNISQTDVNGDGLDVDFIAWGPFNSIADADASITLTDCPTCPNNTSTTEPDFYPYTPDHIVDCSYDAAPTETLTITGAQTGEIYIVLITNYSDDPGSISLQQTGGTGATSCKDLPVCGNKFYDSGGETGDYSNNLVDETTTIYPFEAGGTVTVSFTMFDVDNTDNLKIYNGPNDTAPLLGTFSGTTNPGSFTSTHPTGTLTFVFNSSHNKVGAGWVADIVCNPPLTVCNSIFYDSGGATGNYSNDENQSTTFHPNTPGDAITVTFTFFDVEASDALRVYDGPNNGFSLLGTFNNTNIPTSITSSHTSGALTFEFESDGSTTHAGWEANITCAPYTPPPVCGGFFYDTGGPMGNYSNGQNITTTLYPEIPGTLITVTFTSFLTEAGSDTLTIYDGPDSSYPQITGSPFSGSNSPGVITSTDPSGALTFVFVSDGSLSYSGWEADITCNSPCDLAITEAAFPMGADSCTLNYSQLTATSSSSTDAKMIIFSDDFTSGISGWNPINATDGGKWIHSNTSDAGGTPSEVMLDWEDGFDVGTWSLTSNPIDITSYTSLELNLKHTFDFYSTEYPHSFYIETSSDNINWTSHHFVDPVTADVPAETLNLDISTHDGNNTLYIKFRFTGNIFGMSSWSIDDVIVTADAPPTTPQITWSPTTGLYTDSALTNPYTGGFTDTVYAAPNGTQTYTATDQIGCTDTVTVTRNRKVWNGSISTNWFTSDNWTPTGVPTNQNCVIIPNANTTNHSPIVDSATSPGLGKTLLVETNGYLEVESESGLIITDDITVDGKFILRNSSNLVQITNTGVTNTGNIQMQRTVNDLSQHDYVYWSSPVENFAVTDVSPGSNQRYKWLPTTTAMYGNWQATTEIMQPAKGYIIRGVSGTNPEGVAATNTVEFTGVPRNGRIQIPIMHGGYTGADYAGAGDTDATELDDNWNLIGNPYPSSISADLFIAVNGGRLSDTPDPNTPAIYGTVYVWTHATAPSTIEDPFYGDYVYNYNKNDYIGYNSTGSNPAGFSGNIAAGQAFFVLMDHNASSPSMVTFNNSMRYNNSMPTNLFPYDNSQFFRTSQIDPVLTNRNALEKHRIWLDLIAPNNRANSILVGYIENATDGIDKLYDGIELSETSTRFYSIIEDEKMAIQGKALPFEDSDTVPLGVVIPQAGNYTIAINTMDGLFENTFQDIFLEDTYTGIIHDLRVSPYSLNIDAGTYNDRFILRYTNETLSIENHNLASGLEIYTPNNNSIEIKSKSTIQRVSVYDLLGRTLENHNNINSTNFSINNYSYAVGTYIVKVTLSNGAQKSQKVVLKR